MPVFAISIVKRELYHGEESLLGNTYHYKIINTPSQTQMQDMANEISASEKLITDTSVDFVSWRCWGPTDSTELASVILGDGTLTGAGSGTNSASAYREVCPIIAWPLPRSPVLNRKRWLRKFLRSAFGPSGATPTTATIAGQAPINAAMRTGYTTYANAVLELNIGGAEAFANLCTSDGVEPNGPPEIRDYLYTRQIGR